MRSSEVGSSTGRPWTPTPRSSATSFCWKGLAQFCSGPTGAYNSEYTNGLPFLPPALCPASKLAFSFLIRRRCLHIHNPAPAATTTKVTTTPMTIPLTFVVDFFVVTSDTPDGKADAPRFEAPAGVARVVDAAYAVDAIDDLVKALAAVLLAARIEGLVEVTTVEDMVFEISLPFGVKRTPVPLLQQFGELSQQ